MPADWGDGPQRFPTTSWSLVALAGKEADQAAREALGQLLARYLPALRAHLVCSKRIAPDRADDVVQDFVAKKILERDLIARADRDLGKFRTFLLTALDRFLLNQIRDAGAKKRAAGEGSEALGERAEWVLSDSGPSDAFDVEWARGVLAEAVGRMRDHCESSDRMEVWGIFELRILAPIVQGTEPADYRELVKRFGLRSPSQASNVLMTAKRMYERVLRSVVAEYARDEREIDEEIGELRGILARSSRTLVQPLC
ncbi:MAG: sigma-70 family RNA polymerase sigma factor [Planctomycetes bacterium]|nr:sigma-70 family RNA polymerase sigma factor [Planctomycetota bacterium]MBL7043707.1 sigma-70 family RNA polymerase sigma factor [Pirellulaceae bacterium]